MSHPDTSLEKEIGKVRALVVDDRAELAEKIRELLETIPNVETVGISANGEEAVRMCLELRPQLVVMDIQMPVMNGIEAARAMRVDAPETRIVLTSACGPAGTLRLPGLDPMEFVPKAQLWRALPDLVEQFFVKKL